MKRGKCLKTAKILESLNHPNVLDFKNVYHKPLARMFEYVSFSFLSLGIVREMNGLDGFLWLLNYFWAK